MAEWTDAYWWSNDGLRLHYRDYAGPADRPTVLCLPGLTRNARDFANLAARVAGDWRVLCPELRGRGESAYARDPMTYAPLIYLQDIERLLEELRLARVVIIGTSLGGILAMLLRATDSERVAGALLNDVGPTLDPTGIARIRATVGKGGSWPTWLHAARTLSEVNRAIYPDYALEDWLTMAKRLCRLTPAGRIVPDYDMKIAEPFRLPGGEAGVDLWPAFDALAGVPTALVRGELSDLLSRSTVAEMQRRHPALDGVEIARVGHAPTLDEPEAAAAVDRLLARVLAG